MPEVSVLMSVYNEKEHEMEESIRSMIAQTYADWEFIIVNDNPSNAALRSFLEEAEKWDHRIRIVHNPENIGLALSMNRAAEHSTGRYLARMDADDISLPERFQDEVDCLNSGKYDLVFTNFLKMDEAGTLLRKEPCSALHQDHDIARKLCTANIIHHPTVMMTRDIFLKAGQYRDFPCAQDYDLWLRLVNCGCRFHMLKEVALHYRIRSESVSSRKRLQQKLTLDYIRSLFVQRLRSGSDSYSREAYDRYIDQEKQRMQGGSDELEANRRKLQLAIECRRKRRYAQWLLWRVNVFLTSPIYRQSYWKKWRTKIAVWWYFNTKG